jgi:SAM-dependent methyltransferase
MESGTWTDEDAVAWIASQKWYQTIPVRSGITTPGTTDTQARLQLIDFDQFAGKTVIDIGCNAGAYVLAAKQHGAARAVGVEPQDHHLTQARTLASIMGLDVEFYGHPIEESMSLGTFDVVMSYAVVTEVTDLIESLITLSEMTTETLIIELAILGKSPREEFRSPFGRFADRYLNRLAPDGVARLRPVNRQLVPSTGAIRSPGWAWVPNMALIRSLLGEEFAITDLGPSVRYRLLRFDRLPRPSDS